MIRLALKNLWARRSSNGWLFAELIIVAVLAWVVVDPVTVQLYDVTRPVGYDRDRLVYMAFKSYNKQSIKYSPESADSLTQDADYRTLCKKIASLPEVESLAPTQTFYGPEKRGNNITIITEPDTLLAIEIEYAPGSDYFTTLGIKAVEGSPTPAELDRMSLSPGDMIVTESFAEKAFPGQNPVGKGYDTRWGETRRVVGVVGDMRLKSYMNSDCCIFFPSSGMLPPDVYSWGSFEFIVKLRPGTDADRFADNQEMAKSLATGNFYCNSVRTVAEEGRNLNYQIGLTSSLTLNMAMLIFFLASLALGVVGIFWLQTRSRSEEAGVMKSYGASSGYIVRLMMLEGAFLTFISWVIGCLLYLQYAVRNGLGGESRLTIDPTMLPDDWINDFPVHFGVVAGIILVLMLAVVLAGIYIPARKISKVNPVDAFRDE